MDQICAAGLSAACGLGPCFDAAHEASARKAIAKYNVVHKPPWNDMQKHLFDGDTGINVWYFLPWPQPGPSHRLHKITRTRLRPA